MPSKSHLKELSVTRWLYNNRQLRIYHLFSFFLVGVIHVVHCGFFAVKSSYFCSHLITMVKSCVLKQLILECISVISLQCEWFIFDGIMLHIFFVLMFYENQVDDILLLKQCFCWYLTLFFSFLMMLCHLAMHLATSIIWNSIMPCSFWATVC